MNRTTSLSLPEEDRRDTTRISLLVSAELHKGLSDLAAAERRSLNKQCLLLIERALASTAHAPAAE